jgi:hypothetical protein
MEYKGYCCWDPVSRRMRTSQDVVIDESCPFYPCPTTDASLASLIDPLSFLLFPNSPPASLLIPLSTLSSSVSSFESTPVVPDYPMKPPVTQFYSHRGACLSDPPAFSDELSSDVPSSSIIEDVPSPPVEPSSPPNCSPEQLVRRNHHLRRPPDCYSPSVFIATALSEPTSYHDAIFIRNGSTRWLRRLLLLSRLAHVILCSVSHVFIQSLVSGSIRLRLTLMVFLIAIRHVLLLVVFNRRKVVIMMRLLLLLLI